MNKKLKQNWDNAIFELAKQIKKDNKPSPYSYMVISSSTYVELFFTSVFSVSEEDFKFSTKPQYEKKLKELKPNKIKSLTVFFLLDYFAFLKNEMDPKFFDILPITYEEFLNGFLNAFKAFPGELALLNKVIDNYEMPYHSRTFLQRTGLPKSQDDTFLIYTLNELKFELFHQFNKNISRIIKVITH